MLNNIRRLKRKIELKRDEIEKLEKTGKDWGDREYDKLQEDVEELVMMLGDEIEIEKEEQKIEWIDVDGYMKEKKLRKIAREIEG